MPDKLYSAKDIERALKLLELYELAKNGNDLLDSFFRLMRRDADRSHAAMEHLQELLNGRKFIILDSLGGQVRVIYGGTHQLGDADLVKFVQGNLYTSFNENDVVSGILNIKIDKGESNGN